VQCLRDRSAEPGPHGELSGRRGSASGDLRWQAWQWALANRADGGLLPSGREGALQYGRRERWGRLVKRSGAAGEFAADTEPGEPACVWSGSDTSQPRADDRALRGMSVWLSLLP
jgi:hypothetical protein